MSSEVAIPRGYAGIKIVVLNATRDAVLAGVPRSDVIAAIEHFELAIVNAYAAAEKRRKFLEACRSAGTAAMAKREGVTQRSIRRRREKYLNEKGTLLA